jgi:FMN-dependent NADH-azoreductase
MIRILHIDSSPRGERSRSRRLSSRFVQDLLRENPGATVVHRDLGRTVVPLIDETWIAAVYTAPDQRTPEMEERLRVSDELIDELLAADVLVLALPMYNFGIPANLKAWIDQVVRSGRTFRYPGPEGLAAGRKAYIIMSSAGEYHEGSPTAHMDHAIPQLKTILEFIGITDITVVPASLQAEAA